jgi:hypothetical protein
MRDLTLNEVALADAHVALKLGIIDPEKSFCCHTAAVCVCGQRFCADCGISKCDTCRLRADIIETLHVEFGVEIDEQTASEGVAVYDRENLAPFCRWISKFDPRAPLAYAPMVA